MIKKDWMVALAAKEESGQCERKEDKKERKENIEETIYYAPVPVIYHQPFINE